MSFQLDANSLILLALSLVTIALLVIVILLWIKVRKLLRGKNAESLEDTILNLGKEIDSLHRFTHESEKYDRDVSKRLSTAVRSIETVRFNAFRSENVGGNQSFATSIIDERGNGVVISSIYSRERVSVFAKPITSFASEYELSQEEQSAISKSRESLGK